MAAQETFAVTPVYDAGRGQVFTTPGMRVTVPELRELCRGAQCVQVWCDVCHESIVDCWQLRGAVRDLVHVEDWSTEFNGDWFASRAEAGLPSLV